MYLLPRDDDKDIVSQISLPLQLPPVDDNHRFVFSMWCIGNKYVYRVVGEGIRYGAQIVSGPSLYGVIGPRGNHVASNVTADVY